MTMQKNKQQGFTLVEVMIAMAIMGILMAIAVPSYSKYTTKSRRSDATNMLLEVAGEQQRFLSDQNRYAESMTDLGYSSNPMLSENGLYQISIDRPTVSTFILTATPVAGGLQEEDTECGAFTLRSNGVQSADGGSACW